MRFGSVCSGIEAASVAWEPLGITAEWVSEIEPFPSAVLAHWCPDVPNLGNMLALPTAIAAGDVSAPDILVGGTPCQAFSVAGRRGSLEDERGALTLAYVEIANEIDRQREVPAIIIWENVPGVLNTKDNAFGCFLAGLAGEVEPLRPAGSRWTNAGCVYGPQRTVAWRVLDAQYFGLAQRRRRVFVVASARKDFDPCEVLFEREGMRRDTAPSREAGQDAAADVGSSTAGSHWDTLTNPHPSLNQSHNTGGIGSSNQEVFSQRGAGIVPILEAGDRTGGGDKPHVLAFSSKDYGADTLSEMSPTLRAGGHANSHANAGVPPAVAQTAMAVRRLTPRECERLQGFPDDHTLVTYRNKPAADGPRYKALGNSMAVPVMRWIGKRIVDTILTNK